ncbi:unnamed protein product [Rhodiola kirilowii]
MPMNGLQQQGFLEEHQLHRHRCEDQAQGPEAVTNLVSQASYTGLVQNCSLQLFVNDVRVLSS